MTIVDNSAHAIAVACDVVALRNIIEKLPSGPLKKQLRWAGDALTVSAVFGVHGGQLPGREHEAHRTLWKLLIGLRTALPGDPDVALLEDSLHDV